MFMMRYELCRLLDYDSNVNMILGILVEQESDWTDIATFYVTLLTAVVAILALFVWRAEKSYDLKIEALAKSQRAYRLILHLRSPINFKGEIEDKLLSEWKARKGNLALSQAEESYLIHHSKLERNRETLKEIEILREKLWANYNDTNPFLQFYDFVLNTAGEIGRAHYTLLQLSDYELYNKNDFKEERLKARKVVYTMSSDQISVRLDELYKDLERERNKTSWFVLLGKT